MTGTVVTMSDESWWSGVAHRDDEVSLGERPGTPGPAEAQPSIFEPGPGSQRHLAPTVEQPAVDRLTVEHPAVDPLVDPLVDDPLVDDPQAAPPAPAPVVLDRVERSAPVVLDPVTEPAPVVLDPAPAQPPAPVFPPVAQEPAAQDDEVPFWLLPAPQRPGGPVPTGAVPVAPAPAPFPDVPVPPLAGSSAAPSAPSAAPLLPAGAAGPAPSRPSPTTRVPTRSGISVTRRKPGSGGPAVSVGAPSAGLATQARELLDRGLEALGPLGTKVRQTHPVILGAAAAFVLGLLVVLVSLFTFGGGDDEPTALRSSSRPAAPASLAPVDRTTVTASASSVQASEGRTTYGAGNTLDGKPETAWNSNGRKDGAGPGITLTYTFDAPVDLRAITVRNGYIKTVEGKDLFTANSRVKALKVTTDTGEFTWTLDDVKSAQALRKTFGKTKTVTFEIVSIYKGSKYRDVALSEVSFAAAG